MSDNDQQNNDNSFGNEDLENILGGEQDNTPEPEPVAAPQKRAARKRSVIARPTVPLYTLTQVGQIIDFTTSFDAADEKAKNEFFGAFGWAEGTDADGLRVAATVHDNPHEVEAFHLFKGIVDKVWTTGFGFSETIALVGTFSNVEPNVVEAFVVIVNSVIGEDAQVTHKRNTAVADVLGESVGALTALKGSRAIPETVEWLDSLFDIWPGSAE